MNRILMIMVVGISLTIVGCASRVKNARELMEVKSYNEAIELLKEEVKAHPKNTQAYYLCGLCYLKMGNEQYAKDWFDKAINLDPNQKKRIARELSKEGLEHARKGEVEAYDDWLFLAYQYNPEELDRDEDFFYYYHVRLSRERLEDFRRNFPGSPRLPEVYQLIAEKRFKEELFELAKDEFRNLAKNFPQTPEGQSAKARLADWWCEKTVPLPLDNRWHLIIPVKKGKSVNLSISGNLTFETVWGQVSVGPKDVEAFFGSYKEMDLALNCLEYISKTRSPREAMELGGRAMALKREYFSPGSFWFGQARRSGFLWLHVRSGGTYSQVFSVTVRWKD